VSIGTDISVVERRLMQLGAGSEAGGAASPAIPRRFAALVTGETERLVRRAAQEGRVDPALALAVTSVESGFDRRRAPSG
jgi:soluble lytic murein transglycosylase-like protein